VKSCLDGKDTVGERDRESVADSRLQGLEGETYRGWGMCDALGTDKTRWQSSSEK
jgi:hypothetical protein